MLVAEELAVDEGWGRFCRRRREADDDDEEEEDDDDELVLLSVVVWLSLVDEEELDWLSAFSRRR